MILRASATGWLVVPLPRRGPTPAATWAVDVKAPRVNDRRVHPDSGGGRYLSARCGSAVSAGELDELTPDRPAVTDRLRGEQLAGNAQQVG
jgi:hypothetical protein